MTCAEFADRLEDYVNGSLASAERLAVEAHAALCPACGRLLRDTQEAAALVWLTVPQVEPPPRLRERILTAARADLPAPTAGAGPGAAAGRAVAHRRWRLTLSHLAAAVSALALMLALGLGGWMVVLQGELARLAAENTQLREQLGRQRDALYVLMSPTLVERPLAGGEAAPNARGRLYLDPNRRQGMVVVSELPRLTPDRAYQVWLRGKGGVVSAGLLRMDDRGTGYALLEAVQPLDQFEAIGISLEPAGGSAQPTGPRMLIGSL
jgi:anti-sigma-K factor RskA